MTVNERGKPAIMKRKRIIDVVLSDEGYSMTNDWRNYEGSILKAWLLLILWPTILKINEEEMINMTIWNDDEEETFWYVNETYCPV